MSLLLTQVRRIAAAVAMQHDLLPDIVAVTPTDGESAYAEILLTVRGCRSEPCRLSIGVSRAASEPECRRAIEEGLEEHVAKHR